MNIKTTKHCLICTLNITRGHKVYFIVNDLERAYKRASELLGGCIMLANREKSISHLQELNKKHGQRILKALNERKEHINIRNNRLICSYWICRFIRKN